MKIFMFNVESLKIQLQLMTVMNGKSIVKAFNFFKYLIITSYVKIVDHINLLVY